MEFLKKFFTKNDFPNNSPEAFWHWFSNHEKKFRRALKNNEHVHESFINPLSAKLNLMREGFSLLVGKNNDDKLELVISVDGILKNIVFAEELIALAPQNEHWEFKALKPAMPLEGTKLQMGGATFSTDNLYFKPIENPEYPDEIVLEIIHTEHNSALSHLYFHGVISFLDNYLGELFLSTSIDNLQLTGKENLSEDLVPITKLKDYIIWRQKEIDEDQYKSSYDTTLDKFSFLEASLENGKPLFATVNLELLDWPYKPAYPYTLIVEIKYDRAKEGLPSLQDKEKFDQFEIEISKALSDPSLYIKFGSQLADGNLFLIFMCKEFRQSSKIVDKIRQSHKFKITSTYNIFKDKYWKSLERFRMNPEEKDLF